MTEQDPTIGELNIISREKEEELAKEHIHTSLQLLLTPTDVLVKYFSKKELEDLFSLLQARVNGVYRILENNLVGKEIKVSTGSQLLDLRLGGGISSRQITEICSEQRYPRIQLCYNIMLKFLKEHKDAHVLYNDPYGKLRPERLNELGQNYGLDSQEILQKISVFKPYTIMQQMELFKIYERNLMLSENKFLIIDGLGDFFKLVAKKKNIIYYKIKALENFILRLNYLAAHDNAIVILLNNIIQKFGDNSMIPESDEIIGHTIKTKILLYRMENVTWEAKVIIGEESRSIQINLTDYIAGDIA